jgi:hypothetical protein
VKEYKKSLEDEIDWKIIDQLHAATIMTSNRNLELKKIFFTLVGITVPVIIKLSGDRLDFSLFVTVYFMVLTFWSFDGYTYSVQESLREKMNSVFDRIKTRNDSSSLTVKSIAGAYVIELGRNKKSRWIRSIFGPPGRFYLLLFLLNTLSLILFLTGVIT